MIYLFINNSINAIKKNNKASTRNIHFTNPDFRICVIQAAWFIIKLRPQQSKPAK
jgi:hypothetical protein